MKNNTVFRIGDPYSFLTKELLIKDYLENGLTDNQIAKKYNIGSKATVWRRRKFHGISNSCQNKSNKHAQKNRKFSVSKEQALEWQSQGKTYEEMSTIVGCSKMVLYRRLKELGVVTECKQAMNKLKWHEELTELQTKFLLGDLLGDGNITPWGMYQCNHSYKQKSFIQYKQEMLFNLLSPSFRLKESSVNNLQNGKKYRKYYLRTMSNKGLKRIYSLFYNNGKIFPYKYLVDSEFDAYSLAIWYMDDGSRHQKNVRMHTYGFGYRGNLDIMKFLNEKFDLITKVSQNQKEVRGNDKCHFISFSVQESDKFFSLVAPYILPCFQYKLPPKYLNN